VLVVQEGEVVEARGADRYECREPVTGVTEHSSLLARVQHLMRLS
jgi:hypothetical protein